MNERQNTLIIGGLIFIAGIVLFATFKIKETREEADIESADSLERRRQLKTRFAQICTSSRKVLTAKRLSGAFVVLLVLAAGVFKLKQDAEEREDYAYYLAYKEKLMKDWAKKCNVEANWGAIEQALEARRKTGGRVYGDECYR